MPYRLEDRNGAFDSWFAGTDDPARRQAMLAWIDALLLGPEMVARLRWSKEPTGRQVFASEVPGTGALVSFTFAVAPMRVVWVINIYDFG